jgi:NAD(P)H-dependent flavin oxidoreductase YrpB (nitropropane dioxygenase family)
MYSTGLPGLGITVPIILGPMAGSVGPELVAAVSNAGGLGLFPLWHREPAEIAANVAATRALTSKPFGLNFNNNYPMAGHLDAAIDAGVTIASFFWGLDAANIRRAKDAGMTVFQTIGNAAEARAAVECGADIVVAQGWEAGGHVWSTVATLALVPAVVDAVGPVPVVAAGGIADGRGLAAVLALGASAGWIGTRFLLATEATIDAARRAKVAAAGEADTVMGKDPQPRWRDSAIRWIAQPKERWAYEYGPDDKQLAGQGVGLVRREQPAAEIVAGIWAEARATLAALQHLA